MLTNPTHTTDEKSAFGDAMREAAARIAANPASLDAEIAQLAEYRAPQSTDLDQVLEAVKRLEDGQQTNEVLAELADAIRINNELQRDSNDAIRELARQIAAPRTIVTDTAGKPIGVTIKAD
jgi:hypothetical protein